MLHPFRSIRADLQPLASRQATRWHRDVYIPVFPLRKLFIDRDSRCANERSPFFQTGVVSRSRVRNRIATLVIAAFKISPHLLKSPTGIEALQPSTQLKSMSENFQLNADRIHRKLTRAQLRRIFLEKIHDPRIRGANWIIRLLKSDPRYQRLERTYRLSIFQE